jgi:cellulose synthase (UDP-forming)
LTAVLILVWAVLFAGAALLGAIDISASTQLASGLVVLAVMIALKILKVQGYGRLLFLALGAFIVLRYIMWRSLYTLPPPDHVPSFIAALLLFAAELYAVGMFFLSVFVTAAPVRRSPPKPITKPDRVPTVDIFIPTYNEDADMLAVTVAAATQIRYPAGRMTVWLLDDGGTDQRINHSDPTVADQAQRRRATLQALCAKLGAHYMTRERNISAKAGNLSAALARTSGDLVAVFDADHVPTADFLERTVGYFDEDERLFLVQTPHYFINTDPIERNLGLSHQIPPENEMFYGLIQRGLDKWNGAFFCGSAALLRRRALEEAGGFSGESITEDAETAIDLHARGWRSLYVDHAMIAGLQPETFASFIGQRSRWAQGMTQIFLLKNPLFKRGLSLVQRLCYLSSSAFWFFPFGRLIFMIAPLFYLVFGLEIYRATAEEFVSYTLLYMAGVLLVSNFQFRTTRWTLISELYETAQAPFLIRPILSVFFRPRSPTFRVTAKNELLQEEYLSPMAWPIIALILLLVVGLGAAVLRWFLFPGDRTVVSVVGAWALFNLLIMFAALGAVCERRQRRARPRVDIERAGQVEFGGHVRRARIEDVSMAGAKVRLDYTPDSAAIDVGALVELRVIDDPGGLPLAPVKSRVQNRIVQGNAVILGLSFVSNQDITAVATVSRLMFSDSTLWEKRRQAQRHGPGTVLGMLWFLRLSLTTLARSIVFLVRVGRHRESTRQATGHALTFGERALPVFPEMGEPALRRVS